LVINTFRDRSEACEDKNEDEETGGWVDYATANGEKYGHLIAALFYTFDLILNPLGLLLCAAKEIPEFHIGN
jgi:hypothetical protein